MATRTDSTGSLRLPYRTDEGFLKLAGQFTRTGVFGYPRADGSIVRELRPPEEVNDSESLASFAGKPITLGHPPEFVTPDTVKAVGVGLVGNQVHCAGGYVQITGDVTRRDAIDAIDSGVHELSGGYTCDIDVTPGFWSQGLQRIVKADGRGVERYDQIQRNIRGNHVAIVDRGRAGHKAAFRVDHADEISDPAPSATTHTQGAAMAKIRIDGVEFEATDGLAAALTASTAKRDATDKTGADALTAMTAMRDAEKARADERLDEDEINSRVKAMSDLIGAASPHMGAVKMDGLSELEIKLHVIKRLDGVDLKGKDPIYVGAYFDSVTKDAVVRTDRVDGDRAAIRAAGSGKKPDEDGKRADAAADAFEGNAKRLDFHANARRKREQEATR